MITIENVCLIFALIIVVIVYQSFNNDDEVW